LTEYLVVENDGGERIDRYLAENFEDKSRSYLQKLIKDGQVKVNGKPVKANYRLVFDDRVEIYMPEVKEPDIEPENIPLDILYEDKDVLLVNKPKQMVVHPAPGHYSGTLVNAIMYHCGNDLSGINGVMRPGIVHRIDMDTTGSLVVCKNDMAHQSLSEQLKEHSINRIYEAIVHGNLKQSAQGIEVVKGREALPGLPFVDSPGVAEVEIELNVPDGKAPRLAKMEDVPTGGDGIDDGFRTILHQTASSVVFSHPMKDK